MVLKSHFLTLVVKVKENKEAQERLTHEASHDPLTGLFNRGAYDLLMESADTEHMALLLIDVDYFKSVNDTYGHAVGDKVLKRVADILRQSFRSVDILCRIGGDEFAVIMWNAGVESKEMIREKIASINAEMRLSTDEIPAASISVGVAFGGEGTGRDLFRHADRELYRVKRSGGGGISIRDGSQAEGDQRDGLPEDEIEK